MIELHHRTFKKFLEEEAISASSMPSTVRQSDQFEGLLRAEIIVLMKSGAGQKYFLKDRPAFEQFFQNMFPEEITTVSKTSNIKKFRNSKATKIDLPAIFLLRGFGQIMINEATVDVGVSTQRFGLFAATATSIKCAQICFVENLEPFMNAEKLLGENYLFIHKYGRIGKDSLKIFNAKKVMVFVDYDFNGLDEYLRIKAVFPQAELFLPKTYTTLFQKYSKSLKGNKAKMSNAVRLSNDKIVIKIREEVARNNRFLEQEILFDDKI